MRRVPVTTLGALVFLAACAAGTGGAPGSSTAANVLSAEDLAPYAGYTAREAIQRLKPEWLRTRPASGPSLDGNRGMRTPAVKINGADLNMQELDRIQAGAVAEIKFLSGQDATTLYGIGYSYGLIEVTTRG